MTDIARSKELFLKNILEICLQNNIRYFDEPINVLTLKLMGVSGGKSRLIYDSGIGEKGVEKGYESAGRTSLVITPHLLKVINNLLPLA